MGKMIIGRFIPVDSTLHRMDPRSKLLLVFLFICIVFLANNIWSYLLLIVYVGTLVAISNVPIKYIYLGLRPIFWLIIFTFILHIFSRRMESYCLNGDGLRFIKKVLEWGFSFLFASSCSLS